MSKLIQVQSTFCTKIEAEKVASLLLEKKLAACVQLVPEIESHFWWEGKINQAKEVMLLAKSTTSNFEKIKEIIKTNSSYELPEIIATEIISGDEDYLSWFRKNT